MAYGNNTYSNISAYVNTIYEGALLTMYETGLAGSIVRTFEDRRGMAVRSNDRYGTASINEISESDDLNSQVFTPSNIATLTPAEKGAQFLLTDQRLESDPFTLQQDAAAELGAAVSAKIDTNVFSNFSSLTGGTVGASGSAISWTYVWNAVGLLRATLAPAPYVCVMHPYQWTILSRAASIAASSAGNASEATKAEADSMFFVQKMADTYFYINSYVQTSGTDAYIGVWSRSRPALALDMRRAPRLEYERDASRRAYELNMTTVFAHGVWEPDKGVQGIFALTTPS